MCLLAIMNRVVDDCPTFVAANREELYGRPTKSPFIWSAPFILAGKDLEAGGTWLGVNRAGLLVAVTNRPKVLTGPVRSRGLLCADLLACASADPAIDLAVRELEANAYAGCNLVIADARRSYVVHAGGSCRAMELEPGIYVLSRGDVNDSSDPRVTRALEWLTGHGARMPARGDVARRPLGSSLVGWHQLAREICRDHGDHGGRSRPAICLHGVDRGTVSSSIIALPVDPTRAEWHHAQGAPCQAEYADLSPSLRHLVRSRTV